MAAAHRLSRSGCRVDLIERDRVPGGRCGPRRLGERSVMAGGNLIGHKYTAFREFLTELGPFALEPYPIPPPCLLEGVATGREPLHGTDVLRHLAETGTPATDIAKFSYVARRGVAKGGLLADSYYTKLATYNDHKPLSEHFGPAITETLLRPLTVWAHGAEPDEMYLGCFGATLSTVLDDFDQLADGLAPVLAALGRLITVRPSTIAHRVVIQQRRACGLVLSPRGGGAQDIHDYDAVVVATPAPAAADLISDDLPALGKLLWRARYFPAAVVVVEYEQDVFAPEVSTISLEGPCAVVSVGGADQRNVARYLFAGRPARPLPGAPLLRTWLAGAERAAADYLCVGQPVRRHVTACGWATAYCAYLPCHTEFVGKFHNKANDVAGLAFAGDYLLGASLEACFRSGIRAAEEILDGLG